MTAGSEYEWVEHSDTLGEMIPSVIWSILDTNWTIKTFLETFKEVVLAKSI